MPTPFRGGERSAHFGMLPGVTLHPTYPLRSPRLYLRPVVERDVDSVVAYRSLPDVCRYVPFEPMDAAAVRERLHGAWARTVLEAEGDAVILGVELTASAELIGDVMLKWTSATDRSGEIGYVLHPAYSGQGFATEAAHRLLHLAFDELDLHRVIARVDADNHASARRAARLGMRQEAHLVQNEWFKGRWSDELDFALLEHEWHAIHRNGCLLDRLN
jgi:RimJ/RimL family protein N-acetyltransferase